MGAPVTIEAVIRTAEDRGAVRVLELAPARPFPYRAGQYVDVVFAGGMSRSYSIANAPASDGTITLHVRNTGAGLSAEISHLKAGATLVLEGPHGLMDAEAARARPVLMVAGGTGIAPMLALAQEMLRRGLTDDDIVIVYGVRSEADIHCTRELDALRATGQVQLHVACAPATPATLLETLEADLSFHAVYVSGPEAMTESVMPVLQAHGALADCIFSDGKQPKK